MGSSHRRDGWTSGSGKPRGLFMWSQKVLHSVLLDCCLEPSFQRSSQLVPHGPIATPMEFHPLRIQSFLDRGRQMPQGSPLIKERRCLLRDVAEQLWKFLQTRGLKTTRPLWGATHEP